MKVGIVKKVAALSFAAVIALMSSFTDAAAAPVFTHGLITGEASIINGGTVVSANTLGFAPTTTLVNGVTFGNDHSSLTANFFSGGGDFYQNPLTSGLDDLLSGLAFQASSFATMTFSGLTVGQSYKLQLLFSNDVNSTGMASALTFQGASDQISFTYFQPAFTTIDFIASATSESMIFGNGSFDEAARAIVNAYVLTTGAAVSQVPAPGALALLGFGLLGVAGMRRKHKAN